MDAAGRALFESMAPHGPGWVIATVVVVAVLAIAYKRILPAWESSRERRDATEDKRVEAEIALEARREERKQAESKAREERDVERGRMEGRWVEAMERSTEVQAETTVAIAGIKASMDALDATLRESRDRSARMGEKVDEMHAALVGGRKGKE